MKNTCWCFCLWYATLVVFLFFIFTKEKNKNKNKKQRKCREIYYFKGVFPSLFIYNILNASVHVSVCARVCMCLQLNVRWFCGNSLQSLEKKSWFFCILLNLRSVSCYWLAGWMAGWFVCNFLRFFIACQCVRMCLWKHLFFLKYGKIIRELFYER